MKNDAIQQLKEKGVTFYTLPPEDRKEWMAALKDMPKNFIKECEKRGLPEARGPILHPGNGETVIPGR